jgi:hypothetical protein
MSIYQRHPPNGVARHYPASGSSVPVSTSSQRLHQCCGNDVQRHRFANISPQGFDVSKTPKTPVVVPLLSSTLIPCGRCLQCPCDASCMGEMVSLPDDKVPIISGAMNGTGGQGVCHCAMSVPVPGEIGGPKSGRDPSVSESNRLCFDTFPFFFMNLRYILYIPLKWSVLS